MNGKHILLTALMGLVLAASIAQGQVLGQPLAEQRGIYTEAREGVLVNLRIVDNRVRLYAFDGKGNLVLPPFQKAVVQLRGLGRADDQHVVLRQEGGEPWLSHPRFIRPPHNFNVRLLLYPLEHSDEGMIALPVMQLTPGN